MTEEFENTQVLMKITAIKLPKTLIRLIDPELLCFKGSSMKEEEAGGSEPGLSPVVVDLLGLVHREISLKNTLFRVATCCKFLICLALLDLVVEYGLHSFFENLRKIFLT